MVEPLDVGAAAGRVDVVAADVEAFTAEGVGTVFAGITAGSGVGCGWYCGEGVANMEA